MRSTKKNQIPVGALISLSGNKTKRTSGDLSRGGPLQKKCRSDLQEVVNPNELIARIDSLAASGTVQEAEILLVSSLAHLKSASSPLSLPGSLGLARPASISRLPPALSLGLLVLVKNHPTLFSRPSVMEQMHSLIALAPRDFGVSRLPSSAISTFAARSRGLHVLAANLLMVTLANQQKWPSKLVKVYLEDSLSDRVWVDLEECRAFVLNLETAFPPVIGDVRNLFSILCSSSSSSSSSAAGGGGPSSSSAASAICQQIQVALHLSHNGSQQQTMASKKMVDHSSAKWMTLELTDAIQAALGSNPAHTAKVVHGGDPARMVSLRFESSRMAVELMIVNTLRDVLARRSGGVCSSGVSSSDNQPGAPTGGMLSSGEVGHTRCLIRTLAISLGLPELRSLTALRLEPWLTNPKLQILAAALFAIIATNCRHGTASHFDVDVMITAVYRIRLKLLKSNIQTSVLESVCRIAYANPTNLSTLIRLCLASELPTTSALLKASEMAVKQHQQAHTPQTPSQATLSTNSAQSATSLPSARSISDVVKSLLGGNGGELAMANAALVAAGAAEAAAKGHSSVPFILPKLYQRFNPQWVKIVAEVVHERIVDAVVCSHSNTPHPSDASLVSDTIRLFTPLRQSLRDFTKWIRMSAANQHATQGQGQDLQQQTGGEFFPCAELGQALLLLLDRTAFPNYAEAASTIGLRLLKAVGGEAFFTPFVVLRYIYAVVHVIVQLQLLSVTRPNLCDAPAARKKTGGSDAVKQHQACVRQLRVNFLRWFKSFVPQLISSSAAHFPPSAPRDAFSNLVLLLRRGLFLEARSPLDVAMETEWVADSERECGFSAFYAADEFWPSEQDQRPFVRHLTYVNLPEKPAIQILRYGTESHWGLFSPAHAALVVCELIWRSTALSIDNLIEPTNFVKSEQLIGLLYTCCTYCPEHEVPSELTELAYSETYWKVSLALVALATHSPKTCGAHLWVNYPTVRRLMEMVITNNFVYPPTTCIQGSDANAVLSEQMNRDLETQLILQLESHMARPETITMSKNSDIETVKLEEDARKPSPPLITIRPDQSKLIGQLVRNNPRGACRCPPPVHMSNLQRLSESIGLRRRLCASRQPDFLLELIRTQGQGLPQPWIIELVESVGVNIESLPLQCLSEYLLHHSVQQIRVADEAAFVCGRTSPDSLAPSELIGLPVGRRGRQSSISSERSHNSFSETAQDLSMDTLTAETAAQNETSRSRRIRLDSTGSAAFHSDGRSDGHQSDHTSSDGNSGARRRLHSRILEKLRRETAASAHGTTAPRSTSLMDGIPSPQQGDSIAEAVLQSFVNRLKDSSSIVRRAARHCLALLAAEDTSSLQADFVNSSASTHSPDGIISLLQSIVLSLTGFSVPMEWAAAPIQQPTSTISLPPPPPIVVIVLDGDETNSRGMPMELDETSTLSSSSTVTTARSAQPTSVEFASLILDPLLSAILIEDDLVPLTAYIIFLGCLTEQPTFSAWRPLMSCLSRLVLNRTAVITRLFASTQSLTPSSASSPTTTTTTSEVDIQHTSGFVALETIASIFVRDIDYYCTSAGAIPVNEKNSVVVAWSEERECPMEVETIESHLMLLSYVPRRLVGRSELVWWHRLLTIWFTPSLPLMVPLTDEEDVRTPRGLITLHPSHPPRLSINLRTAFLLSGHNALISTALTNLESDALMKLICDVPAALLDGETAAKIVQLASNVPPKSPLKFTACLKRLTLRSQMENVVKQPINTSITAISVFGDRLLGVTGSGFRPAPVICPISPEPPTGSRYLWRSLVSRFKDSCSFTAASQLYSTTLARIQRSSVLSNKWINDLEHELQTTHTSPRKAGGSAMDPRMLLASMLDLPEPVLSLVLLLIRKLLPSSSDSKISTRYQKVRQLCISKFSQLLSTSSSSSSSAAGCVPLEAAKRQLISRLVISCFNNKTAEEEQGETPPTPHEITAEDTDSPVMTLTLNQLTIDPVVGSLDQQRIEVVTLLAVSSALPADMSTISLQSVASPDNPNDCSGQPLWSLVKDLIFSQSLTSKPRYLLEELVHNSSPSILRLCLRRLLDCDVGSLRSSDVLDFITTVLNLPAFSPPVPFSEPHERPDSGTFYSMSHRLTKSKEAVNLILHVLSEAFTVAKDDDVECDAALSRRVVAVDLSLQSCLRPSLACLEILGGFSESPQDFHIGLDVNERFRFVARRLLLCIYLRRPGIMSVITSARQFLQTPSNETKHNIPSCFTQSEINRLGPTLLIGLSSSVESVREMSGLAALALATHHPRACLRFLPLVAGLSQGRLEGSTISGPLETLTWTKFIAHHHSSFYLGVLQFVEILASDKAGGILFSDEAGNYRSSIDSILGNLIHVVASYPNHARKLAGLPRRLSRLLQLFAIKADWAHRPGCGLLGPLSATPSTSERRTRDEVLRLGGFFNELACLPNLLSNSTDSAVGSLLLLPSTPSKPAKQCSFALLRPFIQKLRNPSSPGDIPGILMDLDKLSERKPEVLIHFQGELENLLTNGDPSVIDEKSTVLLLLKLLFRLLTHQPHRADASLSAVLMTPSFTALVARQPEALACIPDACLLAPVLVPRLLQTVVASSLLDGSMSRVISMVGDALTRLSLDGLDVACIEHAASGLLNTPVGPKFATA